MCLQCVDFDQTLRPLVFQAGWPVGFRMIESEHRDGFILYKYSYNHNTPYWDAARVSNLRNAMFARGYLLPAIVHNQEVREIIMVLVTQ